MSATAKGMNPSDPSLDSPPSSSPGDDGQNGWDQAASRDVLVGQHVGEYVVRRRLGSGGMGVVYEGEHPVIGRKVAIKLLRPDGTSGGASRDLVAEARATSAIRHRGVIDIFGYGTLPGIGQYLVMELLTGRPLDEVLRQQAPLPLAQTLRWVLELLGALSAAHGLGVIHRDLKPGNIFLARESNGTEYVKVLDFGLARQAEVPHGTTPQTRASIVLGTPEYMAPEQACGQPVSPRTDLYAVGILLFEMVTGRLPFQGNSAMHVAIQQVHSPPPAPSSLVMGLPTELEALILRLLAKDPGQRPPSAESVAQELSVLLRTLSLDPSGVLNSAPRFVGSSTPVAAMPMEQDTSKLPGYLGGMELSPTVRSSSPLGAAPAPVPGAPNVPWRGPLDLPQRGPMDLLRRGPSDVPWRGPLDLPRRGTLDLSRHEMPSPPRRGPPGGALGGLVMMAFLVGIGVMLGTYRARESVPATPPAVPAPAPEATPLMPMGTLSFATNCWAHVIVDGVSQGRLPMNKALALPVGTHTLEFKDNPNIDQPHVLIAIGQGRSTEYFARCSGPR